MRAPLPPVPAAPPPHPVRFHTAECRVCANPKAAALIASGMLLGALICAAGFFLTH